MSDLERRFVRNKISKVHVRADEDESPKLEEYAAVFFDESNPDSQYDMFEDGSTIERIAPGAFDDALQNDEVVAVFNHDVNQLLGRNTSGTLRLEVDEVGLRYEVDLPDTELGRSMSVLIGRGDITGSSFAFFIEEEESDREGDVVVYTVNKVSLRDVSPVTWPAYKATSVSQRSKDKVKRYREGDFTEYVERMEKLRQLRAKLT